MGVRLGRRLVVFGGGGWSIVMSIRTTPDSAKHSNDIEKGY
ncbi:hypothetical protein CC1G_14775 [Coprinopsis cinerea okayama7|uniref:Uncharacterized protein n=1 Tax=Coprinopsis cinerea (strain Okayama-7 / 130 / ATCC MYA-4618 / FGSC 9003) TaxID=240176 RepID=D6RNT5_COPC7|nr:hypothetical protein CC1G_14775 [Coprinopsis cinerea okayama7\|eukprot:XP_002910797.1 hypothetical protein CC1G_14775 [Coprinopsis cinerea okayama7\